MKQLKPFLIKLETLYDKAHAQQVARWLLEKVTGKGSAEFLAHQNFELTETESKKLDEYINKLVDQNYPLQYLLGTVQFGPLELDVKPPTLIPRPETEAWVAQLIKQLQPYKNENLTILDMCTGSGCIALWLAHAFPNFTIQAADICPQAFALANTNKKKLGLKNVTFFEGDFFKALQKNQTYDLIVSNPPYISRVEYNCLEPVVRKWESKVALVAKDDGLYFYQKLAQFAPQFLNNSDLPFQIVMEIGAAQQTAVESIFQKAGWQNIKTEQDNTGKARTVSAHLKG